MLDTYLMIDDHQLINMWDFHLLDDPLINFKVKSCNLPLDKLTVEMKKDGTKCYVGREFVENFTLEIYEMEGNSTYDYFRKWDEYIYDKKNKVFKSSYLGELPFVKQGILILYRRTTLGPAIPSKFIKIRDIKLVSLSDLSLNYEDGGPLIYTVTLAPGDVNYQ